MGGDGQAFVLGAATGTFGETDPDSWAAKFVAAGFEVTCLLQGLGQNVAVDDIYVSHVDDAIAKL